MSATVLYMSVSLDGFVAGPNEGPGRARRVRSGSRLALAATPRLPARALGRPSGGQSATRVERGSLLVNSAPSTPRVHHRARYAQKQWATPSKAIGLDKRFLQQSATYGNRVRRIVALERRSRVRAPSVTLLITPRLVNWCKSDPRSYRTVGPQFVAIHLGSPIVNH